MIDHLKHGNEVRGISPPYRVIIISIELEKEKAVWVNSVLIVPCISLFGDFIGFDIWDHRAYSTTTTWDMFKIYLKR